MTAISYIFIQAFIGVAIALSGLLLLDIFKTRLTTPFKLGLAYPTGLAYYTVATLPFYVTNIDFVLPVIAGFAILGCVALVLRAFDAHTFRLASIIAIISIIISTINFTSLSYDSIVMISLAELFTNINQGIENLYPMIASWGIGNIIHQSFYMVFNIEYSSIASEALFLSFIAVLWGWLKDTVPTSDFKYIAGAILALIITTPFIIFQTQYFHNSMPTMALLFCGITSLIMANKNNNKGLLFIGYIILLTMIITRTENAVLATLAMVFYWQYKHAIGYKIHRAELITLSVMTSYILIWYGFLYNTMGDGTDILSPTKAIMVCFPLLSWTILAWVFCMPYRFIQLLYKHILALTACALCLLFTGLIIYDPLHSFISIKSTVVNMSIGGMWGATFWMLGLGTLYALYNKDLRAQICNNPFVKNSLIFTISFFILILIYAYARIPYRIGWGDSGNRMITHILPFWTIAFGFIIGSIIKRERAREE